MRKRPLALLLFAAMLVGCLSACGGTGGDPVAETAPAANEGEVLIQLSDEGVTVDGEAATADTSSAVHVGGEIIYYRDGTDETYGEGEDHEKHSAEEAAAHTVVTITRPGTYRVCGTLSQGQIFVDLGEEAEDDPAAVVTLVLDGADITCTVAPAVFFYRVYECCEADEETAGPVVDTAAAGANVVIAAGSQNYINGSHVARIYKEGTTDKLHKYDGAFYSKVSMNINGDNGDNSGVLNIVSDNEGMNSELHLTINGGTIHIESQDDGINTNEDYISVTTINGGDLTVNAGLGAEGDGIDSNGYLTINGGTLWTMSNERSPDGGIDADCAITINGGTVYAFGTRNDGVDSASAQPYMELSFATTLPAGSVISLTDPEGSELFSVTTRKTCQALTVTFPELTENVAYALYVDGVQQQYTGNLSGMMGGGQRPEGFEHGRMEPPEGMELPEGFDPSQMERPNRGELPEGFDPGQMELPEGMELPEDFDPSQMERPEGFEGGRPDGMMGGGMAQPGEGSTEFILTETAHSFSGISDSAEGAGKTQVSFTVNGGGRVTSVASGETITLSDIQASVDDLPDSDVQITITDVPSEDYAESCLLSDGEEALADILPEDDGSYQLTIAVVGTNETYTGVSQWYFTIGAVEPEN